MIASKYNYQIAEKDSTIFFNGITKSGFRVSNKNANIFSAIINNPEEYIDDYKPFVDKMIAKGFIIDDSVDENERIRQMYQQLRLSDVYSIMILPTYQCNVRCWYCVQEHENLWMSDETIEKIKTRIIKIINLPNIKVLSISWFGGEPMLAYNKVLDLTRWASELAQAKGKFFNSNITTNGTLLTPKRIEELKEAGVNHYQITIDGDRETHNKIKVLGNAGAYDRTIENIGHIIEHTPCTLRYNYTKENLHPESIIRDLDTTLPRKGRERIAFLIYKVWQETANEIPQEKIDKLLNLACEIGIQPRLAVGGMCYADQEYFDCIFTNGKVGKCDNENPAAVLGEINDAGDIEWNGDIRSHQPILDTTSEECLDCKYLPMCWGPCTSKREFMIREKGKAYCQFANKEKDANELIRNAFLNYEYASRVKK